jgi:hypothetical protein
MVGLDTRKQGRGCPSGDTRGGVVAQPPVSTRPLLWPPLRWVLLQSFGVDVNTGGVCDTYDAFVWEPALVKINAIQVRREVAALQ